MTLPKFLPKLKNRLILRRVVGDSMLPALRPNKIIIAFKARKIKPGDVVIIRHDGLEKTKRVKYVQDNKIFVVGDNTTHSTDSRSFGWLERDAVLAKVVWPLTKRNHFAMI